MYKRRIKSPGGNFVNVKQPSSELEDILDVYEYIMRKLQTKLTDEELGAAVRRVLKGDIK